MENLREKVAELSAKEKELNKLVLAAKKAHLAKPDNAKLKKVYTDLKDKYKVVYQKHLGLKRKLKESGVSTAPKTSATNAEGDTWTCPVCNVTIKTLNNNVELHNKGKKHLKAVATQAAEAEEQNIPGKTGDKSKLEDKEHLKWTCSLCDVTIATTAREAHETGKKHRIRLEEQGVAAEKFRQESKAGDWLCRCGQHNYASKEICVRKKCQLVKSDGDTNTPAGTINLKTRNVPAETNGTESKPARRKQKRPASEKAVVAEEQTKNMKKREKRKAANLESPAASKAVGGEPKTKKKKIAGAIP
ncbi:hypothetical protein CYMTET_6124 [Cymbomonas tetramitiformis]|uniref:U1-type domain-containing protein n=1 Tax=Cymbomonas tetramitiformis TaxID=36881 RepID=A0AAE0GY21_9CHLO|nr:hypothetical protein CYMTET_6124 [Cymbomonas tetramitiformis]|eukprot:gene23556-28527_t